MYRGCHDAGIRFRRHGCKRGGHFHAQLDDLSGRQVDAERGEGRGGAGVFHWVAYGIPASVTGFAEGEVSKPSDKYVGGKSTRGVGFYSGPCTPPGTMPHHYTFVLIATDFDPQELPPSLTHDEVVQKIAPDGRLPVHAKGSAGLVGLFVNPWKN